MSTKRFKIKVDFENNCEVWWDAINTDPVLRNVSINTDGETWVNEDILNRFKALPGWDDPNAPTHAPHPLLVIEL